MFSSTKLRQIVGIDRAGSFSAAARTLNVSQSTLTKAVADIEKDIGYMLFSRTARGVNATPEGREFLNRA
ncbi:MAG: LysR family transcriptional regulator, partial [Pseudomonadota bacterium]